MELCSETVWNQQSKRTMLAINFVGLHLEPLTLLILIIEPDNGQFMTIEMFIQNSRSSFPDFPMNSCQVRLSKGTCSLRVAAILALDPGHDLSFHRKAMENPVVLFRPEPKSNNHETKKSKSLHRHRHTHTHARTLSLYLLFFLSLSLYVYIYVLYTVVYTYFIITYIYI